MQTSRFITTAATVMFGLAISTLCASAADFLQAFEGSWKGKGTIDYKGDNPGKDPIACRLTAKYSEPSKSLELSGRCGSVSATSSFKSTLTQASNGIISGYPILQRGEFADIQISGRVNGKSLRLNGKKGTNALSTTFILTAENSFQTQGSRSMNGKEAEFLYINWTK
ncbi:hypothetical protein [uncultured Cohaesibacter sp.]|uniref:hypothetical protein n=1 Tax=uncultured Cohaesibacter sp. TaxID=1002546 RepID=UPI002931143F|nr:hypothetical protein [uncultured Cohaesibacter sp.]